MTGAACLGLPTSWFFVEDDERGAAVQVKVRRAKAICSGCPVQAECLVMAIETRTDHGVFGGTTPRQRIQFRALKPGGQRKVAV